MPRNEKRRFRAEVLASAGAKGPQIDELLRYNENVFQRRSIDELPALPLEDEPFVAPWEGYVAAARERGVVVALKGPLVQLNFPIREGISKEPTYRAVVHRGRPVSSCPLATGLRLREPERIRLILQSTPAGRIAVIVVGDREDFEDLVRAVTLRNEPVAVSKSMGATIVAGFNNWERIRDYRRKWRGEKHDRHTTAYWPSEFKRLVEQRELYQDRFIIASEGPYSGVNAREMGLSEEKWNHLSLVIRLHHECTHYFTKRLFRSMRNNLLDEIIADYVGITAAIGRYDAGWFLRFVGLEAYPEYRSGRRLQNYRGDPPLSDGSFRILQRLIDAASRNLERMDTELRDRQTLPDQGRLIAGLARMTIEEMACQAAKVRFAEALEGGLIAS